jgi:hypothetical protein
VRPSVQIPVEERKGEGREGERGGEETRGKEKEKT